MRSPWGAVSKNLQGHKTLGKKRKTNLETPKSAKKSHDQICKKNYFNAIFAYF